jgi:putative oxidoreductase
VGVKRDAPILSVLDWLCRLTIAAFLGYAAVQKIWNPLGFTDNIRGFRIVGDPWVAWMAMGLPWLELLTAIFLVLGRWLYRGAIVMTIGMFAMFGLAIASAWIRGLDIACGCFGPSEETGNYGRHLATSVFPPLLMALWLWWRERRKRLAGRASAEGA